MNALDWALKLDLAEAISLAAADGDVCAVVLTGAGRGFCASRNVSAAEAASMGFVNRVVPAASLAQEAHAFAATIARGSAVAMALTKTALILSSTASLAG